MKQTVTRMRQAMLGLLLVFMFTSRAMAQTPMHITPTGTSNNVFPLGSTTNMVQWVFIPTDFTTTIPGNSFITTIYLRPNSGSSVTTTTYTNLQIKMGATTATAMAGGTWIGGLTTVLNAGSYTMNPPGTAGGWIPFTLTTPFYYGGGNFYLEISQQGYTGSGLTIAQDGAATARRQWGTVSSSTATNFGAGLVTLGVDVIPADCSGQPTNPTIATPAVNPATPVCIGSTTTITGVNPNLGTGLSVFWQTATSPTGPWSNVTTGSGGNTLTYTTGPINANTYFRMGVNCSFSNLNAYSAAYLVPVGAPQPGTIQGPSTFCPGDTAIYSVPAVVGTTYTWTLPTGWVGSSTTNSIQVRPNGSPGTVSVIATSPCGTSIPQSRAIVNGYAPAAATAINGSAYICAGSSQTYSVAPASGATTYIWSLPAGWKGSLAPTTDTTRVPTITIPAVNNSGTISVRTRNGCGHSQQTSLAVNVISSLASPGTITGRDTVCSGALETYSIAPVNGATSYVWSLPSGWSGTTSGTSVQVFGGTATGTLTVTAYVSCATSPASSRTLTALTTVTPTVSLSTPPGVVCEGTPITFTASSTGGGGNPLYTWRRNNVPVTGTGNTFTSALLQNGDVISVSMLSNASCVTNNTVSSAPLSLTVAPAVTPGISINTLPVTSICRGASFTLNAVATGGGTDPRYEWFINGNSLGANMGLSYTSSTFDDKDTVTIRLHSNAICATEDSVESNRVGIEVYNALTPTVSVSVSPSDIIEPGVPVTFTASQSNGGATPDYQWLRNGVNIPFETGATYTSSSLQPNDHITVRMLSYLSCASPKVALSNAIVMRADPLSVGTRAKAAGLNMYPNPSAGRLNLRGAEALSGGLRLEVLSLIGQVVHRIELPSGGAAANWEQGIELPQSLAEGQYLLRVSTMREGVRQTLGTLPFTLRKP